MRQLPVKVLNAADASVDQTGAWIQAENLFAASAQAVITGTSTGTLKFQFSNDITNQQTPPADPTNASDITGATVAVAGAGVVAIPKFDLCYNWIRLVYVKTNGAAGTITATVKTLGA
jgi:hypothetical protein